MASVQAATRISAASRCFHQQQLQTLTWASNTLDQLLGQLPINSDVREASNGLLLGPFAKQSLSIQEQPISAPSHRYHSSCPSHHHLTASPNPLLAILSSKQYSSSTAAPWELYSGSTTFARVYSSSSSTPNPAHTGASTSASAQADQHQQEQQQQQAAQQAAAQAAAASDILRHLPTWAVPYAQLMRLEKPIGTWLLLWPSLWSIALAAQPGQLPDFKMIALFSLGAVLLRGAGCTVNDLWDRDLDKKVERTRTRPLASGALQPKHAIGLLAAQLSLGLCILLQLNDYSKVLGAASLLLVGTYPLMKRVTYWPQAYLGLTINWGALLGWAAVRGACDWSVVLPLYIAGANWSLVYDTIYAHQDKRDDVQAGVKSTALLFGDKTKEWVTGFAAVQVACLSAAGWSAGLGWPYFVGVGAATAHLAWQIRSVDLSNGPDCMAKFVANRDTGAIIFAAAVAGRLLQ